MDDQALRVVWLAISVLAAVIVASGAGVLARLAGAHFPKAVITAATAFGGALLLILAMIGFVWS
ncbi:hypothetical protein [Micromonospora maris]|uniref:hypothetical protein n=1 Tax=Micromonospora maris TaxID=1003110 RepID=UPI0011D246F7|nr:hypothetical protein [Micromonospora maris]